MPKINLSRYIKIVKAQQKLDEIFDKRREALPKDDYESLKIGMDAIEIAIKTYKKIEIAVAKAYLYELGFGDGDARIVLWNGVGEGRFDFDYNFDIVRFPFKHNKK